MGEVPKLSYDAFLLGSIKTTDRHSKVVNKKSKKQSSRTPNVSATTSTPEKSNQVSATASTLRWGNLHTAPIDPLSFQETILDLLELNGQVLPGSKSVWIVEDCHKFQYFRDSIQCPWQQEPLKKLHVVYVQSIVLLTDVSAKSCLPDDISDDLKILGSNVLFCMRMANDIRSFLRLFSRVEVCPSFEFNEKDLIAVAIAGGPRQGSFISIVSEEIPNVLKEVMEMVGVVGKPPFAVRDSLL